MIPTQKEPVSYSILPNLKLEGSECTNKTHSSLHAEPINPGQTSVLVEHLELGNFKTQPCPYEKKHYLDLCCYYHGSFDKRRKEAFYSCKPCPELIIKGKCSYGDFCKYSHNRFEELYHPEKYKTKFCSFFPNNTSECKLEIFCPFAHSEYDIITELIHNLEYDSDFFVFYYKTAMCPLLMEHNKLDCVYAHDETEIRRKPNVVNYAPVACKEHGSISATIVRDAKNCRCWSCQITKNMHQESEYIESCLISQYFRCPGPDEVFLEVQTCKEGYDCPFAHGDLELYYHPYNYKTNFCAQGQTCYSLGCPFYHSDADRRIIKNKTSNIFKFVPFNRIVENTFKIVLNEHGDKGGQKAKASGNQTKSMFNSSSSIYKDSDQIRRSSLHDKIGFSSKSLNERKGPNKFDSNNALYGNERKNIPVSLIEKVWNDQHGSSPQNEESKYDPRNKDFNSDEDFTPDSHGLFFH